MAQFACSIVGPTGEYFRGEVWQVLVRTPSGGLGVRAHHCDMVVSLVAGTAEVALSAERRRLFRIEPGVLRVANNTCVISCEGAEEMRAQGSDTNGTGRP